jgi:hypothetical protein
LIDPSHTDFMSYCDPAWISDYNFKTLFQRLKLVNGAEWIQGPEATYERIAIGAEGDGSWLEPITLTSTPSGEPTEVTVQTPNGAEKRIGYYYRYSHIEGGRLLVPAAKAKIFSLSFKLGSLALSLPH